MSTLLSVRDMQAWHGRSQAIFAVDLEVNRGEVVALMGRNGMGKTTAIRTVCGLCRPCSGEISFDGRTISEWAPHRIARAGIGLVPEGRRCFPNLSVRENLLCVARPGHWDAKLACRLFPALAGCIDRPAATLSGGEQQMLAIARALVTNPRLLIMDEATEGLAPLVRAEIWAAVRNLQSEGMSILLVDKAVEELLSIAARCVILEKGRTCWTGPPDALTDAVAERYLGV